MAKDYFDVLFVGLFLFKKADQVAVMPDGRHPSDNTIAPHFPFIVVDPKGVIPAQSKGWEGNDQDEITKEGLYQIDTCTIDITKATEPGKLDTTQHDASVVNLRDVDKSYVFAETNIITQIKIGQGTLGLFRRPAAKTFGGDPGLVSRLRVGYDGPITITVAIDEKNPRILALKPGTDIAICNGALRFDPAKTGNQFKLYGQIAKSGTIDGEFISPKLDTIPGKYQVFKLSRPIGDGSTGPGPGGCCPP